MEDYEILGIDSKADLREIKHAYRRLMKELHPDSNGKTNKIDDFIRVQKAYDRLVSKMAKDYNEMEDSFFEGDYNLSNLSIIIEKGEYELAFNILKNIDIRDGEWYYYASLISIGKGDIVTAKKAIKKALEYDYDNMAYKNIAGSIGVDVKSEKSQSYWDRYAEYFHKKEKKRSFIDKLLGRNI